MVWGAGGGGVLSKKVNTELKGLLGTERRRGKVVWGERDIQVSKHGA